MQLWLPAVLLSRLKSFVANVRGRRPPCFSSTTHVWKRCKPSLLCERDFQPLFLSSLKDCTFRTPQQISVFPQPESAHFCVTQGLGNAAPDWHVFLSGLSSLQGTSLALAVLPMCPVWICSHLTLLCPWSLSPSSRQSGFSLVAKPVVAGPGCEFCFRHDQLCDLEQMT